MLDDVRNRWLAVLRYLRKRGADGERGTEYNASAAGKVACSDGILGVTPHCSRRKIPQNIACNFGGDTQLLGRNRCDGGVAVLQHEATRRHYLETLLNDRA